MEVEWVEWMEWVEGCGGGGVVFDDDVLSTSTRFVFPPPLHPLHPLHCSAASLTVAETATTQQYGGPIAGMHEGTRCAIGATTAVRR